MLEAISSIEALSCYAVFPFFGMSCTLNRAAGNLELYYLRHPSGELHALFQTQPGVLEVPDGHFGEGEIDVTERPNGALGYMEEPNDSDASDEFRPVDDELDTDPEDLAEDVTDSLLPMDAEFP